MKKQHKAYWITTTVIVMILAVAFILGGIYKNQMAQKQKQRAADEQAVVDKISKLLRLPNETPISMTVYNEKDFQNNDLFRTVKTGDKILVYLNSKQAIIYRPSTNQVIEVLPVKGDVRTKQ
jgi:uncharacterized protein YpmB